MRGELMKSSFRPTQLLSWLSARHRSMSIRSSVFTPISPAIRSTNCAWCLPQIEGYFQGADSFSGVDTEEQKIGRSQFSVFGQKLSLLPLRWMAKLGIFRRGWLDCQRVDVIVSPRLCITFPAKDRSRSNHVCHSPPPYVETMHCFTVLQSPFDTGCSRKQGLSECAPMILNPLVSGWQLEPTANAIRVDLLRVKKYLCPLARTQLLSSLNSLNPFFRSSFLHQSMAWKGERAQLTKVRKLSARSLLLAMRSAFMIAIQRYYKHILQQQFLMEEILARDWLRLTLVADKLILRAQPAQMDGLQTKCREVLKRSAVCLAFEQHQCSTQIQLVSSLLYDSGTVSRETVYCGDFSTKAVECSALYHLNRVRKLASNKGPMPFISAEVRCISLSEGARFILKPVEEKKNEEEVISKSNEPQESKRRYRRCNCCDQCQDHSPVRSGRNSQKGDSLQYSREKFIKSMRNRKENNSYQNSKDKNKLKVQENYQNNFVNINNKEGEKNQINKGIRQNIFKEHSLNKTDNLFHLSNANKTKVLFKKSMSKQKKHQSSAVFSHPNSLHKDSLYEPEVKTKINDNTEQVKNVSLNQIKNATSQNNKSLFRHTFVNAKDKKYYMQSIKKPISKQSLNFVRAKKEQQLKLKSGKEKIKYKIEDRQQKIIIRKKNPAIVQKEIKLNQNPPHIRFNKMQEQEQTVDFKKTSQKQEIKTKRKNNGYFVSNKIQNDSEEKKLINSLSQKKIISLKTIMFNNQNQKYRLTNEQQIGNKNQALKKYKGTQNLFLIQIKDFDPIGVIEKQKNQILEKKIFQKQQNKNRNQKQNKITQKSKGNQLKLNIQNQNKIQKDINNDIQFGLTFFQPINKQKNEQLEQKINKNKDNQQYLNFSNKEFQTNNYQLINKQQKQNDGQKITIKKPSKLQIQEITSDIVIKNNLSHSQKSLIKKQQKNKSSKQQLKQSKSNIKIQNNLPSSQKKNLMKIDKKEVNKNKSSNKIQKSTNELTNKKNIKKKEDFNSMKMGIDENQKDIVLSNKIQINQNNQLQKVRQQEQKQQKNTQTIKNIINNIKSKKQFQQKLKTETIKTISKESSVQKQIINVFTIKQFEQNKKDCQQKQQTNINQQEKDTNNKHQLLKQFSLFERTQQPNKNQQETIIVSPFINQLINKLPQNDILNSFKSQSLENKKIYPIQNDRQQIKQNNHFNEQLCNNEQQKYENLQSQQKELKNQQVSSKHQTKISIDERCLNELSNQQKSNNEKNNSSDIANTFQEQIIPVCQKHTSIQIQSNQTLNQNKKSSLKQSINKLALNNSIILQMNSVIQNKREKKNAQLDQIQNKKILNEQIQSKIQNQKQIEFENQLQNRLEQNQNKHIFDRLISHQISKKKIIKDNNIVQDLQTKNVLENKESQQNNAIIDNVENQHNKNQQTLSIKNKNQRQSSSQIFNAEYQQSNNETNKILNKKDITFSEQKKNFIQKQNQQVIQNNEILNTQKLYQNDIYKKKQIAYLQQITDQNNQQKINQSIKNNVDFKQNNHNSKTTNSKITKEQTIAKNYLTQKDNQNQQKKSAKNIQNLQNQIIKQCSETKCQQIILKNNDNSNEQKKINFVDFNQQKVNQKITFKETQNKQIIHQEQKENKQNNKTLKLYKQQINNNLKQQKEDIKKCVQKKKQQFKMNQDQSSIKQHTNDEINIQYNGQNQHQQCNQTIIKLSKQKNQTIKLRKQQIDNNFKQQQENNKKYILGLKQEIKLNQNQCRKQDTNDNKNIQYHKQNQQQHCKQLKNNTKELQWKQHNINKNQQTTLTDLNYYSAKRLTEQYKKKSLQQENQKISQVQKSQKKIDNIKQQQNELTLQKIVNQNDKKMTQKYCNITKKQLKGICLKIQQQVNKDMHNTQQDIQKNKNKQTFLSLQQEKKYQESKCQQDNNSLRTKQQKQLNQSLRTQQQVLQSNINSQNSINKQAFTLINTEQKANKQKQAIQNQALQSNDCIKKYECNEIVIQNEKNQNKQKIQQQLDTKQKQQAIKNEKKQYDNQQQYKDLFIYNKKQQQKKNDEKVIQCKDPLQIIDQQNQIKKIIQRGKQQIQKNQQKQKNFIQKQVSLQSNNQKINTNNQAFILNQKQHQYIKQKSKKKDVDNQIFIQNNKHNRNKEYTQLNQQIAPLLNKTDQKINQLQQKNNSTKQEIDQNMFEKQQIKVQNVVPIVHQSKKNETTTQQFLIKDKILEDEDSLNIQKQNVIKNKILSINQQKINETLKENTLVQKNQQNKKFFQENDATQKKNLFNLKSLKNQVNKQVSAQEQLQSKNVKKDIQNNQTNKKQGTQLCKEVQLIQTKIQQDEIQNEIQKQKQIIQIQKLSVKQLNKKNNFQEQNNHLKQQSQINQDNSKQIIQQKQLIFDIKNCSSKQEFNQQKKSSVIYKDNFSQNKIQLNNQNKTMQNNKEQNNILFNKQSNNNCSQVKNKKIQSNKYQKNDQKDFIKIIQKTQNIIHQSNQQSVQKLQQRKNNQNKIIKQQQLSLFQVKQSQKKIVQKIINDQIKINQNQIKNCNQIKKYNQNNNQIQVDQIKTKQKQQKTIIHEQNQKQQNKIILLQQQSCLLKEKTQERLQISQKQNKAIKQRKINLNNQNNKVRSIKKQKNKINNRPSVLKQKQQTQIQDIYLKNDNQQKIKNQQMKLNNNPLINPCQHIQIQTDELLSLHSFQNNNLIQNQLPKAENKRMAACNIQSQTLSQTKNIPQSQMQLLQKQLKYQDLLQDKQLINNDQKQSPINVNKNKVQKKKQQIFQEKDCVQEIKKVQVFPRSNESANIHKNHLVHVFQISNANESVQHKPKNKSNIISNESSNNNDAPQRQFQQKQNIKNLIPKRVRHLNKVSYNGIEQTLPSKYSSIDSSKQKGNKQKTKRYNNQQQKKQDHQKITIIKQQPQQFNLQQEEGDACQPNLFKNVLKSKNKQVVSKQIKQTKQVKQTKQKTQQLKQLTFINNIFNDFPHPKILTQVLNSSIEEVPHINCHPHEQSKYTTRITNAMCFIEKVLPNFILQKLVYLPQVCLFLDEEWQVLKCRSKDTEPISALMRMMSRYVRQKTTFADCIKMLTGTACKYIKPLQSGISQEKQYLPRLTKHILTTKDSDEYLVLQENERGIICEGVKTYLTSKKNQTKSKLYIYQCKSIEREEKNNRQEQFIVPVQSSLKVQSSKVNCIVQISLSQFVQYKTVQVNQNAVTTIQLTLSDTVLSLQGAYKFILYRGESDKYQLIKESSLYFRHHCKDKAVYLLIVEPLANVRGRDKITLRYGYKSIRDNSWVDRIIGMSHDVHSKAINGGYENARHLYVPVLQSHQQ